MSRVKSTKYLKWSIFSIILFWQVDIIVLSLVGAKPIFVLGQVTIVTVLAMLGVRALRLEELKEEQL